MFEGKSYAAVLRELYGFRRLGIRPALPPVKSLLRALGSPHKKGRFIHVAGTNGKGSTVAMIAAVLKRAGYKTGAFYSPHVTDYRERFLVNGKKIPKKELMETLRWMGAKWTAAKRKNKNLPEKITFFEWSVALAFCCFAKRKLDVSVMETGMGGRFDATNVVDPMVSVITNISREHTKYLGKTKAKIAAEKGGIIKRKRPVVLGDNTKSVLDVIKKIARGRNAKVYRMGEDFKISASGIFTSGAFKLKLQPSMTGRCQILNGALAAEAVLRAGLPGVLPEHIEGGIAEAEISGRFERIKNGREIIYDGAHNPAAFRQLVFNLNAIYPGKKFDVVMGILNGKDYKKIMSIIAPYSRRMFCIKPDNERAIPAETIARAAREIGIRASAIENPKGLRRLPVGRSPLLVTGSFTTLAAVKKILKRHDSNGRDGF
jgi:dihydrofolate synthase/folylpolyglutamate synthase